MNHENACALSHVTKRYGKRVALQDLTLSVPKGHLIGVLGPNGSGKSTLFRTLMGITKPDEGSVEVLGNPPGWRTNATSPICLIALDGIPITLCKTP